MTSALPTPSKRSANFISRVCADPSSLVELMARTALDDLAEQLQAMSTSDMTQLWSVLALHVEELTSVVEAQGDAHAYAATITELESMAEFATRTATAEGVAICADALHVATVLHDLIFELDRDDCSALQDAIVCMCESWWHANKPGREALVPQAVAYVLVRALGDDATNADVRRAAALRGALGAIDFEIISSASIKKLLLHTLICPRFLRHAEGRRFLVGLFALSDRLVPELHAAIKNQLPVCRPSLRAAYSDLYARAWRAAAGGQLSQIEGCIQDLMLGAVHARTSAMAAALRATLSAVHALQGTSAAADSMLSQLWEPILWRSVRVPNPLVRRNATAILFAVFPLAPVASAGRGSTGGVSARRLLAECHERQWAIVSTLLVDDCSDVRVLAAHGACRALALYGASAPAGVPKALITRLTSELAHDVSSAAVRVAALEGLRFLVENALVPHASDEAPESGASSIMLAVRASIGQVSTLAHDSCERVRAALVALLLSLRNLRAFSWTSIVQPEQLARRLPLERAELRRKIGALLVGHYLPAAAGLSKMVALLGDQPLVACSLLELAPKLAKPAVIARLVGVLVEKLAQQHPAAAGDGGETLTPVLLALATLLDSEAAAASTCACHVASELRAHLTPGLADSLWLRTAGQDLARGALRRIASRLPEGEMPVVTAAVTAECAAVLRSANGLPSGEAVEHSPRVAGPLSEWSGEGILACVCAWDRTRDLIAAVSNALAPQAGEAPTHAAWRAHASSELARAGKRGRNAAALPAVLPSLPVASSDDERNSLPQRVGHAAGLVLQFLADGSVRAQLLAGSSHLPTLTRVLQQLSDWLPLMRPSCSDEATADARLRVVRAHSKLALHLCALAPWADATAGVDEIGGARPRFETLAPVPAPARKRSARSRTVDSRDPSVEPAAEVSASAARAAGERELLVLLRWAVEIATSVEEQTTPGPPPRPSQPLAECPLEHVQARDVSRLALPTSSAWVCSAMVLCADVAVEMAALGLCSAGAGPAGRALSDLRRAACDTVVAGLGVCTARADGATVLCVQRRALMLAWHLLDGSSGSGSTDDASRPVDSAKSDAVSLVLKVLDAVGGDENAAVDLSAASREMRAGLGALLALSAHAPQLQMSTAPLVEGLIAHVASRSQSPDDGTALDTAAAAASADADRLDGLAGQAGGTSATAALDGLRLPQLALACAEALSRTAKVSTAVHNALSAALASDGLHSKLGCSLRLALLPASA